MSPYTSISLRSPYKERHHVLLAVHQTLQLRLESAKRLLHTSRQFLLRWRGIRTRKCASRVLGAAPDDGLTPEPRVSLNGRGYLPELARGASRRSGKTKRRRSEPWRRPWDRSITAGWRLEDAASRRRAAGIAAEGERRVGAEPARAQNIRCDAKKEVPGSEASVRRKPARRGKDESANRSEGTRRRSPPLPNRWNRWNERSSQKWVR